MDYDLKKITESLCYTPGTSTLLSSTIIKKKKDLPGNRLGTFYGRSIKSQEYYLAEGPIESCYRKERFPPRIDHGNNHYQLSPTRGRPPGLTNSPQLHLRATGETVLLKPLMETPTEMVRLGIYFQRPVSEFSSPS